MPPHHTLLHPAFLQRIHRFAATKFEHPVIFNSVSSSWSDTIQHHHSAFFCWKAHYMLHQPEWASIKYDRYFSSPHARFLVRMCRIGKRYWIHEVILLVFIRLDDHPGRSQMLSPPTALHRLFDCACSDTNMPPEIMQFLVDTIENVGGCEELQRYFRVSSVPRLDNKLCRRLAQSCSTQSAATFTVLCETMREKFGEEFLKTRLTKKDHHDIHQLWLGHTLLHHACWNSHSSGPLLKIIELMEELLDDKTIAQLLEDERPLPHLIQNPSATEEEMFKIATITFNRLGADLEVWLPPLRSLCEHERAESLTQFLFSAVRKSSNFRTFVSTMISVVCELALELSEDKMKFVLEVLLSEIESADGIKSDADWIDAIHSIAFRSLDSISSLNNFTSLASRVGEAKLLQKLIESARDDQDRSLFAAACSGNHVSVLQRFLQIATECEFNNILKKQLLEKDSKGGVALHSGVVNLSDESSTDGLSFISVLLLGFLESLNDPAFVRCAFEVKNSAGENCLLFASNKFSGSRFVNIVCQILNFFKAQCGDDFTLSQLQSLAQIDQKNGGLLQRVLQDETVEEKPIEKLLSTLDEQCLRHEFLATPDALVRAVTEHPRFGFEYVTRLLDILLKLEDEELLKKQILARSGEKGHNGLLVHFARILSLESKHDWYIEKRKEQDSIEESVKQLLLAIQNTGDRDFLRQALAVHGNDKRTVLVLACEADCSLPLFNNILKLIQLVKDKEFLKSQISISQLADAALLRPMKVATAKQIFETVIAAINGTKDSEFIKQQLAHRRRIDMYCEYAAVVSKKHEIFQHIKWLVRWPFRDEAVSKKENEISLFLDSLEKLEDDDFVKQQLVSYNRVRERESDSSFLGVICAKCPLNSVKRLFAMIKQTEDKDFLKSQILPTAREPNNAWTDSFSNPVFCAVSAVVLENIKSIEDQDFLKTVLSGPVWNPKSHRKTDLLEVVADKRQDLTESFVVDICLALDSVGCFRQGFSSTRWDSTRVHLREYRGVAALCQKHWSDGGNAVCRKQESDAMNPRKIPTNDSKSKLEPQRSTDSRTHVDNTTRPKWKWGDVDSKEIVWKTPVDGEKVQKTPAGEKSAWQKWADEQKSKLEPQNPKESKAEDNQTNPNKNKKTTWEKLGDEKTREWNWGAKKTAHEPSTDEERKTELGKWRDGLKKLGESSSGEKIVWKASTPI